MNDIKKIKYQQDYVYYIEFDDGTTGYVDFSHYLHRGPVFQPLSDISFFKKATLEGGTMTWANGLDIAPETLYQQCEQAASMNT